MKKTMVKVWISVMLASVAILAVAVVAGRANAQVQTAQVAQQAEAAQKGVVMAESNNYKSGIAIGIGLSIVGACVGAGYAVGRVGSAALGAVTENPDVLGKSLIFVGLAEGIAIYGLIIAIMLIGKL